MLGLSLCLLACQAPPSTPLPPVGAGVCERLAYVFLLIARNREQGLTRDQQLEMARDSVDSPFSRQPERTVHQWEQLVDLVYRQPPGPAEEVEARALDGCAVNRQGRAVLLWPREE